ncbi:MAG: endonuclease MutS2 [Pyrinomonadaceae bacterium]
MYSLETLQFQQLLALFVRHCRTTLGADRFADLAPYTSRLELNRELAALGEAMALARENTIWHFSELPDPNDTLDTLRVEGAHVDPLSLLEIATLSSQALSAKRLINDFSESAPTLAEIAVGIDPRLKSLADEINSKILPTGEFDDSASPELRRIRREINNRRAQLTKSLESLISQKSDAVQDDVVTIRNDRYVIPVKADFAGRLPGVAHGASSSGATIFVEPLAVIEANNELLRLRAKEEGEIAKILYGLSESAREMLDSLFQAAEIVGILDFISAKTIFAKTFDATIPVVSDGNEFALVNARHPLLEEGLRKVGEKVVPASFGLSKENPVMVISGANAGGKTIVLKTAGLLALMSVCGLPVPADEARVPFYASIAADIGDHQSIASNLSTFSSHVSNISGMFENLRSPSLVLLDEVGTGTDPDEGSALGVAVVDAFRKQGAQVMASTHYKGLKIYAANDPNVINASVEFDERTLEPTYVLLTGLAGASSGIEIARRFGIPEAVIDDARSKLDESGRETEAYLSKLQEETRKARDLRRALEEEREATAERYSKLDLEFQRKENQRRKEFGNSLEEALADFERQAKTLLRQISDKKERKKIETTVASARSKLVREQKQATMETAAPRTVKSDTLRSDLPLEEGAKVYLKSFDKYGRLEKLEGRTAHVAVGSLRMKQPIENLVAVEIARPEQKSKPKPPKKAATIDQNLSEQSDASELNLIGLTTMEAEDEVDRFLDDSYAAKLMRVRIVHGHGTGALRNFVRAFLKGHPHVENFSPAPQNEGGTGATIVELKN